MLACPTISTPIRDARPINRQTDQPASNPDPKASYSLQQSCITITRTSLNPPPRHLGSRLINNTNSPPRKPNLTHTTSPLPSPPLKIPPPPFDRNFRHRANEYHACRASHQAPSLPHSPKNDHRFASRRPSSSGPCWPDVPRGCGSAAVHKMVGHPGSLARPLVRACVQVTLPCAPACCTPWGSGCGLGSDGLGGGRLTSGWTSLGWVGEIFLDEYVR